MSTTHYDPMDRAELIAECERLRHDLERAMNNHAADLAEIERLRADLEPDAMRYRWMRDKSHSLESHHGGGLSCYHMVGGVRELKSMNELDAAVDAARMPSHHHRRTPNMTEREWKRRYAARIMACAGWNERAAMECAQSGYEMMIEGSEEFADYPEDAADEEMVCWTDDGDE